VFRPVAGDLGSERVEILRGVDPTRGCKRLRKPCVEVALEGFLTLGGANREVAGELVTR
jgi:hypothetical protein